MADWRMFSDAQRSGAATKATAVCLQTAIALPSTTAPLTWRKAYFFEKKKQKTSDILLGERTN